MLAPQDCVGTYGHFTPFLSLQLQKPSVLWLVLYQHLELKS